MMVEWTTTQYPVDSPVPQSPASGLFVISVTAPTDTRVLWIDSSNPSQLVMKVYYNGEWVPLAGGGGTTPETFRLLDHLQNRIVDHLGNYITFQR